MDILIQLWILLFGGLAVWFVGRLESWKRWGYIFGLISQPAFLYSLYINWQWGMFLLSLWYTYCWGQGIYNYWIKKGK